MLSVERARSNEKCSWASSHEFFWIKRRKRRVAEINKIDYLSQLLNKSKKLVVLTGAGVSTGSGIPDFRSANGIYDRIKGVHYSGEEALSINFLRREPELFYRNFIEHLYFPEAEPSLVHRFIARLERPDRQVTVLTQNIDGLHQKAGSSRVVELHGSALRFRTRDGLKLDYSEVEVAQNAIRYKGEQLRPDIVLYGEALDTDAINSAISALQEADTLLVLGTSLRVYPVAALPQYFMGETKILVNKEATPLDGRFDLVIHENIEDVLKKLGIS